VTEILPAINSIRRKSITRKYYLKNPADFEAYHVGSGPRQLSGKGLENNAAPEEQTDKIPLICRRAYEAVGV